MTQFQEAQSRLDGCFKAIAVLFVGGMGLAVILALAGNGIAADKKNNFQPKPRVSNPSQDTESESNYDLGTPSGSSLPDWLKPKNKRTPIDCTPMQKANGGFNCTN